MASRSQTPNFCSRTTHNQHYWKKDKNASYKDGNSVFMGFICSFCQMVKVKVLTYEKSLETGVLKAVIKEVIPGGQVENVADDFEVTEAK